jgi:cystine transport system substrate-binding protein
VLRRRKRLYAGIFLLGSVALTVLIPAAGAQRPDSKASLRTNGTRLSQEEQHALLDLYSLETQLAAARARLASVERRQAALEQRARTMTIEVASATQGMDDAQTQLQQQLLALYEQPSPDPIAVVLGAQSLDEAVTRIDNLQRVARQGRAIVGETRATRARLLRLRRELGVQRVELSRLHDAAAEEEARLSAAAGSRRAYVASLQQKRALNRAAIDALDAQAHSAAQKTLTVGAPSTSDVSVAATTTTAAPTAPTGGTAPGSTLTVVATAYALKGHTASGLPTGPGIAAVDPGVIPLGTRFDVPGYGSAVAADVGSGIAGDMIDLWFPTDKAARAWGRRTVTITFK